MRFVILGVSAALLLAGCVAAPAPDPTPVATSEPTSAPTAEPQGEPQPSIPLTCDEVYSEAEAQAITGEPAVHLREDSDGIRRAQSIADRQAGVLSCTWGGENRTGNSYDQGVDLELFPDGAGLFDTNVWQVDDGAIVYPAGSTTSEYLCQDYDAVHLLCDSNLLVDGYWVHARISGYRVAGSDLAPIMQEFIDTITARIGAAGDARPAWEVPEGSLSGAFCATPSAEPLPPAGYFSVGLWRTGARECEPQPGVRVIIVPGGGWGVPLAEGARPYYSVPELQPTTVAGADAALSTCGDGCFALVSVGGSAVQVTTDASSPDEFVPVLQATVDSIVAAG